MSLIGKILQIIGKIFKQPIAILSIIWKYKFFTIFTIFFLINLLIMAFQLRSVDLVVEELGEKFLRPTEIINELSIEIIKNQGVTRKGIYWDLLTQLMFVFGWIRGLSWLILIFPLMDDSKKPVAYFFGILFFFGIQSFYLQYIGASDKVLQPFIAFQNLFKAFPHIFSFIDGTMEKVDNILNSSLEKIPNSFN